MKIKPKKISGYMTIEATFIIPATLVLFLIIIYFGFYLYDTCVVSDGCYLASLRGSQIWTLSESDLQKKIEDEAEKLLTKQVFLNSSSYQVSVTTGQIKVSSNSGIKMLLPNYDYYNKEQLEIDKVKQVKRLNPVFFIREYQKVQ